MISLNKCFVGLITLLLFSCGTETKPIEEVAVIPDEEIVAEEVVMKIEKPINVVTPEHWENFNTDIEMVIMFHQGDSLDFVERRNVDKLKEEFSDLSFHEFYTDDKIAQIFINDTLAFDMTSFLIENENGFVLLKPSVMPAYCPLSSSLSEHKSDFHEFYGNK